MTSEQYLLFHLTKKTKYSFSCSSFADKRTFATNTVLFYVAPLADQSLSVRTSVHFKTDMTGLPCSTERTLMTGFTYHVDRDTVKRRSKHLSRRLARHAVRSLFRLYVDLVSVVRRYYLCTLGRGRLGEYDGRAFDLLPRKDREQMLRERVSIPPIGAAGAVRITNSSDVVQRHARFVNKKLDAAWEIFCSASSHVAVAVVEDNSTAVVAEEEEEEEEIVVAEEQQEAVVVVEEEVVVEEGDATMSVHIYCSPPSPPQPQPPLVEPAADDDTDDNDDDNDRRPTPPPRRRRPRQRRDRGGGDDATTTSERPGGGDDDEDACFMCMERQSNVAFGCGRHFACQQCVRACWKVQQQHQQHPVRGGESFVSCPYCRHLGAPFSRTSKTPLTFPRYRLRMRPAVNYNEAAGDDDLTE